MKKFTLYHSVSGEATNHKGYEGHGDAHWDEQVAEMVESMEVLDQYIVLCHYYL